MTAEPSRWDAYVGAVIRIEAPGGVFWVRPAPVTLTTGSIRPRLGLRRNSNGEG
jgi:hypothetical protein